MLAALPRPASPRSRHLYIVPDRRVARRGYAPPGRALHLVDPENLMGGPFEGRAAIRAALEAFHDVAGVGPLDLVTISTNPALLWTLRRLGPGLPCSLPAVDPTGLTAPCWVRCAMPCGWPNGSIGSSSVRETVLSLMWRQTYVGSASPSAL